MVGLIRFTIPAFESFLSTFFWLDPKEPKGQDTAKLLPHRAGRWPAAVSAHAPIRSESCGQKWNSCCSASPEAGPIPSR